MTRASLATLGASILLALTPVGALAQSGEGQYTDPLAGGGGGGGGGGAGGGGGGGGSTDPATTSSGNGANGAETAQNQSADPATTAPDGASVAAAPAAQDQLPATGLDAWLLVAAGATMLGGGIALRRVADNPGA